ncbi:2-C-methyl-D-erythritol 4-phosphate cytidylyltransferase [Prevotella sp. oral taxon 376]|uniref:2-C-methyl-D-erythritol 4-phosphate cytidylyltransferase n=1 Tax=Prevotella sp. oral taxon 376 TaxID=712466 RepID=UPI000D1F91B5|nr:2-C-methyl-D-erythritol 4-phosphate cytidylyltransferase [Prevotella sp. oral taxon 376]PTL33995.1 2-C-methyl-D-erythritol 4-phosphate cytidylyltransferase [Prevotella sp. oral taxon 376]
MDYIIIVAGGKGLRMGSEVPKQFLPIGGKPVLMRTMERFREYDGALRIILVLPREQQDYWQRLCKEHRFDIGHTLVDGGDTRFASSRNGLRAIPDEEEGIVGIHDGVRPFVSVEVIRRCYDMARRCGAVIPVLPVTDTLRHIDETGGGRNVLRSDYRIVQTPQTFDIQLLKRAFLQPWQPRFTDDASVVEALGHKVEMTEGNRENIKLTTPFDLKTGETIVNCQL